MRIKCEAVDEVVDESDNGSMTELHNLHKTIHANFMTWKLEQHDYKSENNY